jgi:two-component system, NtrC family, sensor kinase
MLKKYVHIIFYILLPAFCLPQEKPLIDPSGAKIIDTLKQQLSSATNDSARLSVMESLGFNYEALNVDSSMKYSLAALAYATEHGYIQAQARVMASLSSALRQQGKFAEALDLLFKSLKIALENNFTYDIARAFRRLGLLYSDLENFPKAVAYLLKAADIDEKSSNKRSAAIDHLILGEAYDRMNKLDSAAFHVDIAFKQKDALDLTAPDIYNINGNIQVKKGNYGQALSKYKEAIILARNNNDFVVSSKIYAGLSVVFKKTNKRDSAIFYALQSFEYGKKVSFKKGIIDAGILLSDLYDSLQPAKALSYYKIAAETKDSLFGVNNNQAIQDLVAREESRQKELEDAQVSYRNKLKLNGLIAGLAALLIIAFILYRNDRHKQKANVLLRQQKEKIETTLNELKSTQSLLIQSEKMASLGELTAGIAHEIQNPLNFVNNFSEVSNELIDEMNAELGKGDIEEAKAISADIKQNLEKINHHGKRADAIVKGMLQHSSSGSGKKQSTDINKLADEYMRLAYHGLRAKDKFFNATMHTNYDSTIGNIQIVPQDIGRVILNLITNAFYVVNEKKALRQVQDDPSFAKATEDTYEPTVSVSTRKFDGKVEIKVEDNGNGIPGKVLDKIFQPFFTTKPAGQGTGLGLSLSYDIVKAHGGEIKLDTKEGVGTSFIIQLPDSLS